MTTNTEFFSFNKYPLIVVCLAFILTACGGGDDMLSLSGTVLDSNGVPVPNAMVTVHSDPVIVHTDKNGHFSCKIRHGKHHIRAEKEGRVFLDKDFTANEKGEHHDLGELHPSIPFDVNATLTGIAITPPTATVAIGQNAAFTATATYSDATTADLTSQVTWSSADTAVATINTSTGIATGVVLGSTSVSAVFSGITAPTAVLTVAPLALDPVSELFPANGANWNDYVVGNASTATDTACDAATDTACVHGGERRVAVATGKTSCTGLTASDDLGAFNWVCEGSANPVRFVSTGLADGKNLSDLIDFGTPGFKLNKVTVYENGNVWGVTPSTAWWSNPVAVNNTGINLNTASTIYLVTSNPAVSYKINANKIALVIQPGLALTGPGISSSVIYSLGHDHLWLEGTVNANYDAIAVDLRSMRFSALRNVAAYNASTDGIYIANSWYNRVSGITASNNGANGVKLATASDNALSGVTASNNGTTGSFYNTYGGMGVYLINASNNNTLSNVTTSSNLDGIYLDDASSNVLSEVTSTNNLYSGVTLYNASITSNYNLLSGVTVSNNGYYGVFLGNSSNNTFSDVVASSNSFGVYLSVSSNNRFTGLLKVGNNIYNNLPYDCIASAANSGLVSGTCANNGSSDVSTLTTGITLTNSFVGKVNVDDLQNISDTIGAASYPADPTSFDWTHFDNSYRDWGIDGSAFPYADQRGRWTISTPGGAGRIWDWSVTANDTILRGVLTLPTGSDTLTHTWLNASATTFLRHAVEISGDGIGNDNGLCESGETCLYTPNIGSYQGSGGLVSAGTFTDGSLTGIMLMKFATNGEAAQP